MFVYRGSLHVRPPCVAGLILTIAWFIGSNALGQNSPADVGRWSAIQDWPNVPIHAHLLPNGKVLFWGRREVKLNESLDITKCTPRTWDPDHNTFAETVDKPNYNLFCSGHTFMADGRLFVAGGHHGGDARGEPFASIYDYQTNKWKTLPQQMNGGRWYPTVTLLPDAGVLVSFGTKEDKSRNDTQQIWKDGAWTEIVDFRVAPYYPRMHVVPDGRVFMTGELKLTQFLDPRKVVAGQAVPGEWTPAGERRMFRDYAPSVPYDEGKIIYIGGGNFPTDECDVIDLKAGGGWKPTNNMLRQRRQHNGTLLPDGKVLVTGGTKGDGDPNIQTTPTSPVPAGPGSKFNDLRPGQPIRSAEMWDPATGQWKLLAKADRDRCYHSVSLLLPDATVLNGGGGEYRPYDALGNFNPNDPADSHADIQIFSPPYLFLSNGTLAPRPAVTSAPGSVQYGATFQVDTPDAASIRKVSWIRLGSVTHAFDAGQRINFLPFVVHGGGLAVTAPARPELCPPGFYMLFILNDAGVPSKAKVIRIGA